MKRVTPGKLYTVLSDALWLRARRVFGSRGHSCLSPFAVPYASRSLISLIGISDHVPAATRYARSTVAESHHRPPFLTAVLQVCQFCFNNIKNNMNGLCPACRRPYDEKTIEWKVVTSEEYVARSLCQMRDADQETGSPSSAPISKRTRSDASTTSDRKRSRSGKPRRRTART